MNDDVAALNDFQGITRLFPLPSLVFFPHAVQPLHIFEPRYRQMTADALEDDRLISLVLLKPGWEHTYDQRPPIHSVACLGRMVADQLLPDGRYNFLLRGLARVRILEEVPSDKLYRLARVETLNDRTVSSVDRLMRLRHELADLVLPQFSEGPLRKQLTDLFTGELPLGHLIDILSFALPLPYESKQKILEESIVEERTQQFMAAFSPPTPSIPTEEEKKKFPPDFSPN